jgi:hypothetical protein
VYIYMYIYIYIHTHTHTHVYTCLYIQRLFLPVHTKNWHQQSPLGSGSCLEGAGGRSERETYILLFCGVFLLFFFGGIGG